MIYQSGYLTIKSYDPEIERFRLDFPNEEVRRGFLSFLSSGYLTRTADSMSGWAAHAGRALNRGDLIPYNIRSTADEKARERDFQYTFYLIFRMLGGWKVYAEKASSRGRADCIVETDSHIYIFEFKLDGTAEDALRQIEEKGYARPYASDRGLLFLRHRQHRRVESGVNRKNMLLQTHDMANNAATSSSAKPKKDGAQE